MRAFARVVYVIERGKKTVVAMRAQEAQEKRRQLAQQTSLTRSAQVCLLHDGSWVLPKHGGCLGWPILTLLHIAHGTRG